MDMKMFRFLKTFLRNDSGAVSVDWVILTASVVFMSAVSFFQIRDNSANLEAAAGGALAEEQQALFPE
ncbi:hypothetical protein M4578_19845 [Salipiger sp. P9]|uniref:Flp family type IVb pilin n=1 Tax=Salipiger pentaromativorans TaxID=2943193 RepID=UPI002158952F|nr:hypothetical protein [Salipiger pentaromativorans]MCR8550081.1 hypothetical protein [Salipiger pentaromativorans]